MDLKNTFSLILLQIIIFIATFFGISTLDSSHLYEENIITKYNELEDLSKFNIYFCPRDDCFSAFSSSFLLANNSINCAFYDLNSEELVREINKYSNNGIKINLIIDDEYLKREVLENLSNKINIYSDIDRNTRFNNYMHHKFCTIDDKLTIISSANPTNNGFYNNNNNIIVIDSKKVTLNFQQEFFQLKNNFFGTNKNSNLFYQNLSFNLINIDKQITNETILFSNYFCPQDYCEKELLNILKKAQKEILFSNFALTLDSVEELLINKSLTNDILVEGIVESRTKNVQGSIIDNLNNFFPIILDKNPNSMHHKFFVIDETWVITGSMNPSNAGTKYNDENLIIIKNSDIAKKYKNEFLYLKNLWDE